MGNNQIHTVTITVNNDGIFNYHVVTTSANIPANAQFRSAQNDEIIWICKQPILGGDQSLIQDVNQFGIHIDERLPIRLKRKNGPQGHRFLSRHGEDIHVQIFGKPEREPEIHKYFVAVVDKDGFLWTDDPEFIIDP